MDTTFVKTCFVKKNILSLKSRNWKGSYELWLFLKHGPSNSFKVFPLRDGAVTPLLESGLCDWRIKCSGNKQCQSLGPSLKNLAAFTSCLLDTCFWNLASMRWGNPGHTERLLRHSEVLADGHHQPPDMWVKMPLDDTSPITFQLRP